MRRGHLHKARLIPGVTRALVVHTASIRGLATLYQVHIASSPAMIVVLAIEIVVLVAAAALQTALLLLRHTAIPPGISILRQLREDVLPWPFLTPSSTISYRSSLILAPNDQETTKKRGVFQLFEGLNHLHSSQTSSLILELDSLRCPRLWCEAAVGWAPSTAISKLVVELAITTSASVLRLI